MSRQTLRVLVVDGALPVRDASAGERATLDQVEGLQALGHSVTFTAVGDPGDGRERKADILGSGAEVPEGFGGGLPHLREILKGRPWDVIIAHRPGPSMMTAAVLALQPKAATIYWGHDIHTWRLNAQQAIRGDVAHHHMRITAVSERRCWDAFDLTVYPTDREATYVSNRPTSIGRGASAPYYRLTGSDLVTNVGDLEGRKGFLMVGGAAHAPNHDAVRYAVHEVLPALRRRDPDATISVVGDWPPASVQELSRPGVVFLGRVTNTELTALHTTHACLLAPLRFGAGSRRKIVAAMGLGLPVVTTAEGLRGLLVRDAAPADGVIVADEPEDLASAAHNVSTSPRMWRLTAGTALESVTKVYSAEVFDRALASVLRQAVALHSGERRPAHE